MGAGDAIGIFDSGVGGLTVLHALAETLPAERLFYLGDAGRHPYGTESGETVARYGLENAEFLLEKGIKLLVVACNTASAVALDALRDRCAVPVVGVIEPGARAAAARTRNQRVGVIGTDATIASGAYTRALRALRPGLEIYTRPCPLLVPLAEEGWVEGPIARGVVETYLGTLRHSGIDTLVLGCTHYPLLKPLIAEVMGEGVVLIDSAEETARDVAAEHAAPAAPDRRGDQRPRGELPRAAGLGLRREDRGLPGTPRGGRRRGRGRHPGGDPPGGVRRRPRSVAADHRPPSLRRPAARRDRAARGPHRRDEDGRGEDPRRHAPALPERAPRQGLAPGHRQRLPRPPRRAVDGTDLLFPRPHRDLDHPRR